MALVNSFKSKAHGCIERAPQTLGTWPSPRSGRAPGVFARAGLLFANRAVPLVTALALYSIATLQIFVPHDFAFNNYLLSDGGTDSASYVWSLYWWPFAITHNLNPFITHLIWAPHGINLTWGNAIPALAVIAWPVTRHWGPIASFNLLTLAAPVLAAFAAFILSYELTNAYCPSLIGGWLFGFSSYELGQLMGHLHLDFVAAIPVLVWLGVLFYRGRMARWVFVAASSAFLVFQFGVSTEIFATATLFGVSALILAYALGSTDRTRLIRLAIALAYAYALSSVVLTPYLYYMVKGWNSVPAAIQTPNVFVADVLNYLVPTSITAVGLPSTRAVAKHFTGNNAENGAYIGLPLCMMIVGFAYSWRRNSWSHVILLLLVVLVVCSFGPYLHYMGESLWSMPWQLTAGFPIISQALPVRFSLYVSLVASLIAALWLDVLKGRSAVIGYLVAFLAVFSLAPNIRVKPGYWSHDLRSDLPAFFGDGGYKRVLTPGEEVIVLPYGWHGYSMLWQATTRMYFRMAGGYVTPFMPKAFAHTDVVRTLYSGKPGPHFHKKLAAFCAKNDVRAVILTGLAINKWDAALSGTGWPRIETGGVVLYQVPVTTRAGGQSLDHGRNVNE